MSINRREHTIGLPALVLGATAGLAAIAVFAVPAMRHWRETPPPAPPALRLELPDTGSGAATVFGLAVSPDGRRLAAAVTQDGRGALWLRELASGESRALPVADGAAQPFWSTDGSRLAYFAGGRLRVLDVASGQDADLAAAASPRGGAWLPSGDLIVAPQIDGPLMRWRADARTLEPFTNLDAAAGEVSHGLPRVAADGRHVIFHVRATAPGRSGIWWAPVDRPAERRRLTGADAHGLLAHGLLLFASDTALMAQRIDLEAGGLLGRPSMIATPVGHGPQGQLFATVAEDGPLFYSAPASTLRSLTWVDRNGTPQGTVGSPADSWDLRLAPTAPPGGPPRVVVTQADGQLGTLDVWAYDGGRALPTRISPAIDADDQGVWSPDATRIAWVQGRRTVMMRGAQAVLPDEALRRFDGPVRLWDWSRDGRWLIVGLSDPATRDDLWLLSARGDDELRPLMRAPFRETEAALSADGRWLAFASDESGRNEIYVDSFPTPTRRTRLTLGGGTTPRWRADGRELYFRRNREIHAITLTPTGPAGAPQASATTLLFGAQNDVRAYDATSDGNRFLLNLPTASATPRVQVIVHWDADERR